jgi:hypothetical protein
VPPTTSLPNAIVTRAYLNRGVPLWIFGKLLLSVALLLAELDPLRVSFQGSILMVALTAILGLVDIHVRGERALIGNLGLSRSTLALIGATPAVVLEVVVAMILQRR